MHLAPTLLIYRTGFAPTNGTSVQLQRLLEGEESNLLHLMWAPGEAGSHSVRWVIDTSDGFRWKRPFGRLGRGLRQLRGLAFPLWWKSGQLNRQRLEESLSKIPLHPCQAYLTCYSESEAIKAFALWEGAGRPPFVLHLMDLFDGGISEEKTPILSRLVRAATHTLCLNSLIEDEVGKVGGESTSLFPLCSDIVSLPRSAPPMPLRLLISGALYSGFGQENVAMRMLCEIWPSLAHAFPGAELHYSGAASSRLPSELRSHIRDHGLLATEDYQKLLLSCHIAYVPISQSRNASLRFSMPSRIPDYLMSGLPVIARAEPETGIHEFFQSTPEDCTRLVHAGNELLLAVRDFAESAEKWERASRVALDFSNRNFAVAPARTKLFQHLNAAGALTPIGAMG